MEQKAIEEQSVIRHCGLRSVKAEQRREPHLTAQGPGAGGVVSSSLTETSHKRLGIACKASMRDKG